MKKITKLKILTASILIAQQSYAFEQLSDDSLGSVTGQDGITITHEISKATINAVNWVDSSSKSNPSDSLQRPDTMKLGLKDVTLLGVNNQPIVSKLDFDVGTTARGAGIRIEANISPFELAVKDVMLLCTDATKCQTPQQSLGSLDIKTSSPLRVLLQTQAGLFNRDETAHLNFQLQNASISHGLNGQKLTLKDFNFNFSGDGYMYLSSYQERTSNSYMDEGIVLTTKSRDGATDHVVMLGRVDDSDPVASANSQPGRDTVHSSRTTATNPGINIDLRYGSDPTQQRNLIRMGASGAVTNATIFLNANQSGITDFGRTSTATITGYDAVGLGGLHFGVSADFTREGNTLLGTNQTPTTLEIGHTGNGSYAIEFSNLSPLTVRNSSTKTDVNTKNAYIDFGDIYINAIQAKSLDFLINDKIKKTLGVSGLVQTQQLSSLEKGNDFALIAIRGMDFQSIARKARFIADNSLAEITNDTSSWGIGIPIYNLNANVALAGTEYTSKVDAGTKKGIAYNVMASTDGYGIDKKTGAASTTSLILIDGKKGLHDEEVNYYAGLRNIDAFVKAKGVIGYEEQGIYISADDLLVAASAEIAIGQLPGSLYNCTTGSAKCGSVVPVDNFARKDDVLTSIAFKLDGKGDLFIIPGMNDNAENNFLSFRANFEFNALSDTDKLNPNILGSYFSLINEDVDANNTVIKTSSINFNKLQGALALESRVKMQKDTVIFDNKVDINPAKTLNQVFRTELSMSTMPNQMQKMADIAITGGSIRSNLGITPR
ncbi:hypothetical protein E0H88_07010 [Acinetobacter sp. ANC 4216]|uniref:DUF6160 family protein n=1 Tax=Acinetobacter sp. ANC 4216 TaxID=2529840 RepID=UPI00103CB990|nr:DUF6160 family protein [Acinetobacter sp. ANC 4216]TCB70657.1 hypothetical protein E0H88_07010 [Acinetobacter sp. ANC 4216]